MANLPRTVESGLEINPHLPITADDQASRGLVHKCRRTPMFSHQLAISPTGQTDLATDQVIITQTRISNAALAMTLCDYVVTGCIVFCRRPRVQRFQATHGHCRKQHHVQLSFHILWEEDTLRLDRTWNEQRHNVFKLYHITSAGLERYAQR